LLVASVELRVLILLLVDSDGQARELMNPVTRQPQAVLQEHHDDE
jgi:hypothetical protein